MTPALRTITMQTHVMDDRVLYTVWDGDPDAGDFGDAREVWRKDVPFGTRDEWRAAGYRFVEAAREQEAVAMKLSREQE